MGIKWASSLVFQNGLLYVQNGCTAMSICSSGLTANPSVADVDTQPGAGGYALAKTTCTTGVVGHNPVTTGVTSSTYKLTSASRSGLTIDTSGEAWNLALYNSTNVLMVTACTSQTLTSGGTVDTPAWTWTITEAT